MVGGGRGENLPQQQREASKRIKIYTSLVNSTAIDDSNVDGNLFILKSTAYGDIQWIISVLTKAAKAHCEV